MTDVGRSPDGSGHSAEPEPCSTVSAVPASVPNAIWLVWASEGEYSDRSEWPVVATADEASAERLVVRLEELWRSLDTLWRVKEADDDFYDKEKSEAFWNEQPEAVEYTRLTGRKGEYLGGCYTDERSYTCCEISVLPASAIEAQRAETLAAPSSDESAVPEGGTPHPNSPSGASHD